MIRKVPIEEIDWSNVAPIKPSLQTITGCVTDQFWCKFSRHWRLSKISWIGASAFWNSPLYVWTRNILAFFSVYTTLTLKTFVILSRFQIMVIRHHCHPHSRSSSLCLRPFSWETSHNSLCPFVSLAEILGKQQSPLWKGNAFLLFLVPQMYPDHSPEWSPGKRFPVINHNSFF